MWLWLWLLGLRAVEGVTTFSLDEASYSTGDTMLVTFNIDGATTTDWFGITWRDESPPSITWQYTCGGRSACSSAVSSGTLSFDLSSLSSSGEYDITLFANNGYEVLAGPEPFSYSFQCAGGTGDISSVSHVLPEENSPLTRLAFSSCYKPSYQINSALWEHMRESGTDLWLWLGDNQYSDGTSMETKRQAYNAARDDTFYQAHGPVAEPKIPVMATWDDHDYGANNQGDDYRCPIASQNEFVIHFGIPASDPRHPSKGDEQQHGVYSSTMFSHPLDSSRPGVHVIALDARSGRTPTFSSYGSCQGASSRMLSDEQWTWLDGELNRDSEIKVIATGIQVLPPTNLQSTSASEYCAYDGVGGTFDSSIAAVGENSQTVGTSYESWAEMPQQRASLLQKCQKSINDGHTKQIIFVSGDQHWAEIMVKEMPASDEFGPAVQLHEVTASGIDQSWNENIYNANRARHRTADHQGDGLFDKECNFPFRYQGVDYYNCTLVDEPTEWCSTNTDSDGNHIAGSWGYCLEKEQELAQNLMYNGANTCTNQVAHICTARANYGAVEVDWATEHVRLQVWTPHEAEALAVQHTIALSQSKPDVPCLHIDYRFK